MAHFSNHLTGQTSPYLLQHAHNPVNWYPWGEEALQRALSENRPILVSIGYAACHWCHVMERESFEDEEIARIMNDHFINIKIDREERPDLDHIYMDAVQAMTGSGGWPLNVFLTPAAKPFYGGTYFPPKPAFNRPSWREVLLSVSASFADKKADLEAQAENLRAHLVQANDLGKLGARKGESDAAQGFERRHLDLIFSQIMKTADTQAGGFGRAPKFPQSFTIQFLLHYHHFTGEGKALAQACLSLDKMIRGGLYDQLGGGFARYATDEQWLVPHFEKMLYDNALLVMVLSDAYLATQNDLYQRAIEQTIEFIRRELLSGENGFYASLDADSEGEEGKYYVWAQTEIQSLLQDKAPLFCDYYGITEQGNWEGRNILHVPHEEEAFAARWELPLPECQALLADCRALLFTSRQKRIPPGLDHKIILSWNALMNTALCKAYIALGHEEYKKLAKDNMDFLLSHLKKQGTYRILHSYAGGEAKIPGFLDDVALLTAALIQLQEITGETGYLLTAKELTEYVLEQFSEVQSSQFFYTHQDQKDLIFRKKEVFDGATPSGNSVMCFNLLYLSIIFDIPIWKQRAIDQINSMRHAIMNYPTSFGVWADLALAMHYGIAEMVVTAPERTEEYYIFEKVFFHIFIPFRVYQSATRENSQFPLLISKPISEKPRIYLCKDYSCQKPTTEIEEFKRQLINLRKNTD